MGNTFFHPAFCCCSFSLVTGTQNKTDKKQLLFYFPVKGTHHRLPHVSVKTQIVAYTPQFVSNSLSRTLLKVQYNFQYQGTEVQKLYHDTKCTESLTVTPSMWNNATSEEKMKQHICTLKKNNERANKPHAPIKRPKQTHTLHMGK